MKAGLIAPSDLLQGIQPYSNYHLILVHKVLYDHRYREFYAERSKKGDYIILDNAAVENNGRAVPLKTVALAAFDVKPNVMFLPDFLFDAERTLDEIENALLSPHIKLLLKFIPGIKFAAVVQGLDEDEWLECFEILDSIKGLDILGIPMIAHNIFGNRLKCLDKIAGKVKHQCHLLGARGSLEEVVAQANYPFVLGIDTAKPVRLAVNGMRLEQWSEVPKDRRFLDKRVNGIDLSLLQYNCEQFVERCAKGA